MSMPLTRFRRLRQLPCGPPPAGVRTGRCAGWSRSSASLFDRSGEPWYSDRI